MARYHHGVIRVGEGQYTVIVPVSDPCEYTWMLYVVYLDHKGRRMIQEWSLSKYSHVLGYKWDNDKAPKPLVEFWGESKEWHQYIKWYGLVPIELGKTTSRSVYYESVSTHWEPEDSDSEDEFASSYDSNYETYPEQLDEHRVRYDKRKAERAVEVKELMKKPIPNKFYYHTVTSKAEQIHSAKLRDLYKNVLADVCLEASYPAYHLLTNEFMDLGIIRYAETIYKYDEQYYECGGGCDQFEEGSLAVVFVDESGQRMIQHFYNSTGGIQKQHPWYEPNGDPEHVEIYWREVDVETYIDQKWIGLIARGMYPELDAKIDKQQREREEEIAREEDENIRQQKVCQSERRKQYKSVGRSQAECYMKPCHKYWQQKSKAFKKKKRNKSERKSDHRRNF